MVPASWGLRTMVIQTRRGRALAAFRARALEEGCFWYAAVMRGERAERLAEISTARLAELAASP